jgi:hypothetical protein
MKMKQSTLVKSKRKEHNNVMIIFFYAITLTSQIKCFKGLRPDKQSMMEGDLFYSSSSGSITGS